MKYLLYLTLFTLISCNSEIQSLGSKIKSKTNNTTAPTDGPANTQLDNTSESSTDATTEQSNDAAADTSTSDNSTDSSTDSGTNSGTDTSTADNSTDSSTDSGANSGTDTSTADNSTDSSTDSGTNSGTDTSTADNSTDSSTDSGTNSGTDSSTADNSTDSSTDSGTNSGTDSSTADNSTDSSTDTGTNSGTDTSTADNSTDSSTDTGTNSGTDTSTADNSTDSSTDTGSSSGTDTSTADNSTDSSTDSGTNSGTDSSTADNSTDSSTDTGTNSGTDSSTADNSTDSSTDTGTNSGTDTSTADNSTDSSTDTGTNSGTDTSTADNSTDSSTDTGTSTGTDSSTADNSTDSSTDSGTSSGTDTSTADNSTDSSTDSGASSGTDTSTADNSTDSSTDTGSSSGTDTSTADNSTNNNQDGNSNDQGNEEFGDIQIDEKEIEKVNRVLASENHESNMKHIENLGGNFDTDLSNILNHNNENLAFLAAHKRENGTPKNQIFDIFKIKNFGEDVQHYRGLTLVNAGRLDKVDINNNGTYLFSKNPSNLFVLDEQTNEVNFITSLFGNGIIQKGNTTIQHDSITLNAIAQNQNLLCGLHLSNTGLSTFKYDTNSSQLNEISQEISLPAGSNFQDMLLCDDGGFYLISHSKDTWDIYYLTSNGLSLIHSQTSNQIAMKLENLDGSNYLMIEENGARIAMSINSGILTEPQPISSDSLLANLSQVKTFISDSNFTLDNPILQILFSDPSGTILNEDKIATLNHVPYYSPQANNFKTFEENLLVQVQGNKLLTFDYTNDSFNLLGSPLGLSINSITHFQGKYYLPSEGNNLLEWDPNLPWTFGSLEYAFVDLNSENHNPKLYDKISFNKTDNIDNAYEDNGGLLLQSDLRNKSGSLLYRYDPLTKSINDSYQTDRNYTFTKVLPTNDAIVTAEMLSKAKGRFKDSNSAKVSLINKDTLQKEEDNIPVPGKSEIYDFNYSNNKFIFIADETLYSFDNNSQELKELLNYQGIMNKNLIKTPNEKYLTITEGKVYLVSPITNESKLLFEIPSNEVSYVSSASLFDDKLLLIDQSNKVHRIHLSYADLNLFDE